MSSLSKALICASMLLFGCDSGHELRVDLRTDFVPGAEFNGVEIDVERLDGPDRRLGMYNAFRDAAMVDGVRVADFRDLSSGDYTVRVYLRDSTGAAILERRVELRLEGDYSVTVVGTRDCANLACGDEQTCVAGRCVDPACTPENPDACPAGGCTTDAECPAPAAMCAAARCVVGACFSVEADDSMCGVDQFCAPDTGCTSYPTLPDAGPPTNEPPTLVPTPYAPWLGEDTGFPDAPGLMSGAAHPLRPKLAWREPLPADATYFEVDIAVEPDFGTPLHTYTTVESFLHPSDTLDVRRHYWRVRACNASGCGAAHPTSWFFDAGTVTSDVDGDSFADIAVGDDERDEGHLYVYRGRTSGPPVLGPELVDGEPGEGNFGGAVTIGDLNNDGLAEVIVASPLKERMGLTHVGEVRIYSDDLAAGISLNETDRLISPDPSAEQLWFGEGVLVPGDLNGDGYDDLVVGEPGAMPGSVGVAVRPGRVHVYFGGSSGIGSPVTLESPRGGTSIQAGFGGLIRAVGDLDGDGYVDIATSARAQTVGAASAAGEVYLLRGGPDVQTTWASSAPWIVLTSPAPATNDKFGSALVGMSDLNADGYDELVVGAYGVDGTTVDSGAVYLYFGGPDLAALGAPILIPAPAGALSFGQSIASGDFDDNLIADLVIGAPDTGVGGAVYTVSFPFPFEAPYTLPAAVALSSSVDTPGARLGHCVSVPGFVRGGAAVDVLVTAPGQDRSGNLGIAQLYSWDGSELEVGPMLTPVPTLRFGQACN